MSGGVDSSVAAHLLLEQGYDVVGCFLRLGTPAGVEDGQDDNNPEAGTCSTNAKPGGGHKQGCCSVLDAGDARRVAQLLGIPFYVLNFKEDFDRIINYFVSEYNQGRTPNPCVRCNDWLKFGKLAQYAEAVGADYVASGHYARVGTDPADGSLALLRGLDNRKDQSYVLFGMTRRTLEHTLLPVGDYEKPRVREMAEALNLPVFNKPDSQEICFVPDQDYAGLLKRRSPESVREGEIVGPDGTVIGRHQGHQNFTIGQRRGVGVALGYPIYVVDVDAGANRVRVGGKNELTRTTLTASQANWLSDRVTVNSELSVHARIRYNHEPVAATLRRTGGETFRLHFAEPQPAVTPGQAVVCYDDQVVLGGGWIDGSA